MLISFVKRSELLLPSVIFVWKLVSGIWAYGLLCFRLNSPKEPLIFCSQHSAYLWGLLFYAVIGWILEKQPESLPFKRGIFCPGIQFFTFKYCFVLFHLLLLFALRDMFSLRLLSLMFAFWFVKSPLWLHVSSFSELRRKESSFFFSIGIFFPPSYFNPNVS